MICPFCSHEMTKGKIMGDRGALTWAPAVRKKTKWKLFRDDVRMLKNLKIPLFRSTNAEAYACENCGKLIAEIEMKS